MSLRLDMQFRVHDDLISGKLVAWGFREGAHPEEGPTLIPAHLFPRDREDTAAVDWKASTLRSSGHFFDRIRVTKPRSRKRSTKPTKKATQDGQTETTASQTDSDGGKKTKPAHPSEPPKPRMGRPSKDAQIREILQQLKAEGWDFLHRFQKETCNKVIEVAQAKALDTSRGFSDPVLKRLIREIRDEPN
jgi:hypothetical protein